MSQILREELVEILEKTTDDRRQRQQADSLITLWPYINQLEGILTAMNAEMEGGLQSVPNEHRPALNQLHSLLGAAETISGVLAEKCGVR